MPKKNTMTESATESLNDTIQSGERTATNNEIHELSLNVLRHYKNHPFKPYSGKRFEDMVQSIRDNGVMFPIIVRPLNNEEYEILAGHNRVEASRVADKETIPAIIRGNLTDDEALLIVTESNLIQRGFEGMSHSERALAIASRHEVLKKQGNNSDIITEIENMLQGSSDDSPVANKQTIIHKIGKDYSLSKDTVARYLRVNKLIEAHKKRLDSDDMGVRTAVALSYLSQDEQQTVDEVMISNNQVHLSWESAKFLRDASENKTLDNESVEKILHEQDVLKSIDLTTIKIQSNSIPKRFSNMEQEELDDIIVKALELYDEKLKAKEKEDAENTGKEKGTYTRRNNKYHKESNKIE